MTRELYLSRQVQRFFTETLDLDSVYHEGTEATEARKLVETFVDDIITSRETISDNNVDFGRPGRVQQNGDFGILWYTLVYRSG